MQISRDLSMFWRLQQHNRRVPVPVPSWLWGWCVCTNRMQRYQEFNMQINIISSTPTASLLINLLQFLISSTCTSMDACLTFLLFSIRIDVDECVHPDAHSCYGICKNLPGSFQCQCPQGTYGDPTTKGGCITIKNSFPGDESSQYIQLYYCNHKVW